MQDREQPVENSKQKLEGQNEQMKVEKTLEGQKKLEGQKIKTVNVNEIGKRLYIEKYFDIKS